MTILEMRVWRGRKIPRGEIIPVSYTHLDVYKRQGISIMQKVEADRFWYALPEEDIIRWKVKKL